MNNSKPILHQYPLPCFIHVQLNSFISLLNPGNLVVIVINAFWGYSWTNYNGDEELCKPLEIAHQPLQWEPHASFF